MIETLRKYISQIKEYWMSRSQTQKVMMITSFLTAIILISVVSFFMTRTTMVPLYTNLKPSETGSIKENLDAKGIKSEIVNGGTTIKVPEANKEALLVELAAEGIPKSGNVAPTFFSDNASFGMTDNEFNEIKLGVIESKLSEMIQSIDGIQQANVMINLPEKGIFVSDNQGVASASILLHTKPGHEFNEKQIKSLYNLVSKSVPDLSTDNIVIRNQFLEYFDLNDEQYAGGFTQQMQIKQRIERDIQRQVQNMLGTLMGFDKVVSSVTADIDFTQENREENLIEPVDEDSMRGIEISAQRISETFTGNGDQAGGIPQGSDPADSGGPTYQEGVDGNGDFERTEDTINYEVNRIRKEIVESPYKINDLGIQVLVDEPGEGEQPIPEERVEDIRQMLSTIVRTSINKNTGTDVSDEAIQNKITVSVQPFQGTAQKTVKPASSLPWWAYVAGGLLLAIIGVLVFLIFRRRRVEEDEELDITETSYTPPEVPDLNEEILTESGMKRQQLEKLAKEKPDEFAKLLRTWLTED